MAEPLTFYPCPEWRMKTGPNDGRMMFRFGTPLRETREEAEADVATIDALRAERDQWKAGCGLIDEVERERDEALEQRNRAVLDVAELGQGFDDVEAERDALLTKVAAKHISMEHFKKIVAERDAARAEVERLTGVYESAVKQRQEFRGALRNEREESKREEKSDRANVRALIRTRAALRQAREGLEESKCLCMSRRAAREKMPCPRCAALTAISAVLDSPDGSIDKALEGGA